MSLSSAPDPHSSSLSSNTISGHLRLVVVLREPSAVSQDLTSIWEARFPFMGASIILFIRRFSLNYTCISSPRRGRGRASKLEGSLKGDSGDAPPAETDG